MKAIAGLKVRYVDYSSEYDEWKNKSENELTYSEDFASDFAKMFRLRINPAGTKI